MKLLVLGGTEFVGHALVAEGLARGWDVTTLNRGSKPVPEGVEALVGDRRLDGLESLDQREFDLVADTWSWEPRSVRDSARQLADRAARYVYVSSRSVYVQPTASLATESAPTVEASMDDEGFDDYARAKRGAELGVLDAFGDRALIARPGLILGPRENIGRLPWWLTRLARGGDILAPGPADGTFQYIDARDLAAFCLSEVPAGPYSVVNAPNTTTMGELLQLGREVTGSSGTLRWADPDALIAAGVRPWMDLPVWLPAGEDHETMHESDVTKAMAAGLRIRPLRETVADTWSWLKSIGGVAPQRSDRPVLGLDPEWERELITPLIPN
jgi:nucleoside-diphosphate-sugar epimerase